MSKKAAKKKTDNKTREEMKENKEMNEEQATDNVQETPEQEEVTSEENKTQQPEKDGKEEAPLEANKEKTDAQKLQDMEDKYLRLVAEYDNYRKRTLREKMELSKSAGADILVNLLPVKDDFERALSHLDSASDLEAVKEGINLIFTKFSEFLKQRGIKEIEAMEQPFDTDVHEAITKIPAPTEELKGKVVDVVEKGYILQDKVVRFAKVVVGE
ncbi:MAG: nucleotide exchange factor GrpE [Bacteroidales bacterium]